MMPDRFQFESLVDFITMNGHGPYVWGAYGISALVLVYLIFRPLNRRRKLLSTLAEQQRHRDEA